MYTFKVILHNSDGARDFVKAAESMECDVDLVDGSIVVDGKSFIGVVTMDLSEALTVRLHSSNMEDINSFKEKVKALMV